MVQLITKADYPIMSSYCAGSFDVITHNNLQFSATISFPEKAIFTYEISRHIFHTCGR